MEPGGKSRNPDRTTLHRGRKQLIDLLLFVNTPQRS
jgi:hypothetical protein